MDNGLQNSSTLVVKQYFDPGTGKYSQWKGKLVQADLFLEPKEKHG